MLVEQGVMEPYQEHHIRNGLMAVYYCLNRLEGILDLDPDHPGFYYLHQAFDQLERIADAVDTDQRNDHP